MKNTFHLKAHIECSRRKINWISNDFIIIKVCGLSIDRRMHIWPVSISNTWLILIRYVTLNRIDNLTETIKDKQSQPLNEPKGNQNQSIEKRNNSNLHETFGDVIVLNFLLWSCWYKIHILILMHLSSCSAIQFVEPFYGRLH